MADGKHTPGPWSVPHFARPDVGCECGYVLTDGYCGAICTVHCSGKGNAIETGDNPKFEEATANARLIATAPDLLEQLRRVEHTLSAHGKVDADTVLHAAIRAAISKAKGTT